jgi:antitoxin component YwqK of YwqJK toxin-antitoxin module
MPRLCAAFIFLFFIHELSGQEKKQTFSGGKLVAEYTWSGNRPDGPYTQWYSNGKLQSKGTMTSTTKSGTSWWYYETDTLRKVVEFVSVLSNPGASQNYSLTETVTEFWENGNKKSWKKYVNGKEQFESKLWYQNGKLKSGVEFDADNSHRIYTTYFETGERKNERSFLNNARGENSIQDGLYREWNENGVQTMESHMKNGKQDGVFREWSDDGKLINDSYYENNIVIAQKKWGGGGALIVDFDKRKENNEVQAIYYYEDKVSIRQLDYNKKYLVDDSVIVLRFTKQFSQNGTLTTFIAKYDDNPLHHPDPVAFWYDTRIGFSLPCFYSENVKDQRKITGYNGSFLKVSKGYNGFTINPVYNPVYGDKSASTYYISLLLPVNFNPAKPDKILKEKADELKEKLADPAKVRPEYLITDQQAESIIPFYKALIPKVYFDSVVVTNSFDTTRTGPFTITFQGTKMKCTGNLKEGLLDGKFIFWLDDSTRLDERDYRFGMLHGEVKEWYINGSSARIAYYKYNRKSGSETFYYFNGRKKSEAVFAGGENPVSETSWYENGNIQSNCTFYDLPKAKHLEIKDEWYKSGKPKQISLFTDSVYKEATLDEDGKVTSIKIYDAKHNYELRKYYYNNKLARVNTLKSEELTKYDYSFEKNGVTITGLATWDGSAWNMEDNMGKVVVDNRNVLKFSEALPCNCQDYTSHGYFYSPTKDFISNENFQKYQLDFHQPLNNLSSIFGDPNNNFGNYHEPPEKFVPGKAYYYYAPMLVIGDLSLALPDSNGLIFSLTPCRAQNAAAPFDVSISFRAGFPKQTEIVIDNPKTLALSFNAGFLREMNDSGIVKKNKDGQFIGAEFLFSGRKVFYNATREIDVVRPQMECNAPAEFSGTGISIDFNSFLPDMSRTINYPEMKAAYAKETCLYPGRFDLGYPPSIVEEFRGLYSESALITVPVLAGEKTIPFVFTGTDLAIGSHFAIGTLLLNVKSLGNEKYSFVNDDGKIISFTQKELAAGFSKCGWTKNNISFDPEKSQLVVNFYYEK